MSSDLKKTGRTTMSRHAERGSYDREAANAILDEGLVAHVGFATDEGVTVVPMTYARIDDRLVLHGAVASRWLSRFATGHAVSVCVTLLDGLVLAQSAFSHSMNYRSVVIFGTAEPVNDPGEKRTAFRALLDHLVPGRWEDCRQPDRKETDATVVLGVAIEEASVKVRSGPPKDAARDSQLGFWTGVIPLRLDAREPEPEGGRPAPAYVSGWRRPTTAD